MAPAGIVGLSHCGSRAEKKDSKIISINSKIHYLCPRQKRNKNLINFICQ